MKSTLTAVGALVIGAMFAAPPALAQGSASAEQEQAAEANPNALKTHKPKISRDASKQIQALQTAVNSNDPAAIATALAAAQAAAKTADDKYAIGILQLKAAAHTKSNTDIAAAIEAMLASGSVTQEELFPLHLMLANTYSALKQNAQAQQNYARAVQLNPNSVEATAGLAEAKAAQGQAAEALALLQKGIAIQSSGGAKAPEAWYKRAVAIAFNAKLPQAVAASRTWLEAYPSRDSWHDSLAIFQNFAALDDSGTLDLMRLKRAAGALDAADYFNYGDIAVRKGFAGEAKAVLEEGFAASKIKRDDPSFSQLYALASQRTKGDRESLATAPAASSTARQLMVLGDAWYGYGEFAKAAEFYRAAVAKGGAEANTANLHLGMALARQGDKAGASAALAKVTGPEAEFAKYWQTLAATKA